MGAEGEKWLQGVWFPFGEELATTQAQNDTRLEFLKNNQKMYSSGYATGSTSLGIPIPGLPTAWCLDYACPLEWVLGLIAREGPYSREHQG